MTDQTIKPPHPRGPFVVAYGRFNGRAWSDAGTGLHWQRLFATQAAAYALWRSTQRGTQLHMWLNGCYVRPAKWHEREFIRFHDGTYRQPVWSQEGWWRESTSPYGPPALQQAFAHVSTDDPNMIAFTESPEKGERDIQTRMKAGRFLKKFFGERLTDKQIAFFAEWQAKGNRPEPEAAKGLTLKFGDSEDDFERVYRKGPRSCMDGCAGDGGEWPEGQHPCRIYAAGDLAIAYLEDKAGAVRARALVWPERKAMGRIYPSPDHWQSDGWESAPEAESIQTLLQAKLKAEGYESMYENNTAFDGARLIRREWGNGETVMPYVDMLGVKSDGDVWRLTCRGAEHGADQTDGTLSGNGAGEGDLSCVACGEGVSEDDAIMVAHSLGGPENEALCSDCYGEGGGFYCSGTDTHYRGCCVHPVEMASGDEWADSYFADHGFTCRLDGENYPNAKESTRFPGYHRRYDADHDAHPELAEDPNASGEPEPTESGPEQPALAIF